MNFSKQKRTISKEPMTQTLYGGDSSDLKRYQDFFIGAPGLSELLKFELITMLMGPFPGGLGLFLRKQFYPRLFKRVGSNTLWGRNITLRHAGKIEIGDRVAIDDNCLLDAKGAGNEGVVLGDDVIISRDCVIQGKNGPVTIMNKTDIGCNTIISSVSGIKIGHSVLIAGNCYIGGGRYISENLQIPMIEQGVYSKGPVVIGDDVWLGAGAVVIDGIRIGKGCIVGAGAVVTKDLPDYAIATGIPARVIQMRDQNQEGAQSNKTR